MLTLPTHILSSFFPLLLIFIFNIHVSQQKRFTISNIDQSLTRSSESSQEAASKDQSITNECREQRKKVRGPLRSVLSLMIMYTLSCICHSSLIQSRLVSNFDRITGNQILRYPRGSNFALSTFNPSSWGSITEF